MRIQLKKPMECEIKHYEKFHHQLSTEATIL